MRFHIRKRIRVDATLKTNGRQNSIVYGLKGTLLKINDKMRRNNGVFIRS